MLLYNNSSLFRCWPTTVPSNLVCYLCYRAAALQLLDIPDIGMKDKIDRYSRGLKAYIWKVLCTKEYVTLSDVMRGAERIGSAYKRSGNSSMTKRRGKFGNGGSGSSGHDPMEIGNINVVDEAKLANFSVAKLDKAERERCMREELCLRCRRKVHLARDCQKGRRN